MDDDFSRDLAQVMQGHNQMQQNLNAFTQATTPIFSGQSSQQQTPQMQALPPVMTAQPYISPVVAPATTPPPAPLPFGATPQQYMQPLPPMQAPAMSPMMAPPAGSFAYGQQQATQGYINNASTAAYMDPSMAYPGAGQMTQHTMGVFRQAGVSDSRMARSGSHGVPSALFPVPLGYGATSGLGFNTFERTRPSLMFRRGFDATLDGAGEFSRVMDGRMADYAAMSGSTMVSAAGSVIGTGLGAGIGSAGGVKGAIAGANIGSLVGAFAGMIPGINKVAASAFAPAIQRRADAIQTQFGSRRFLTGGNNLDFSGQGLSTSAAQRLTHGFDDIAESSNGRLNRRDVANITQISGEQGLLDFASSGDEIKRTVKGLTGLLATMGEITGDPDFRNNLKKMAQLKRLGFSTGEMGTAMRNMDAYSRMSGMDVDQAMQRGGMQGAAIFQGAGLDAASGLRTGMFTQGAAHLATQAGSFDAQTLALYGGKSGVGQLMTESNAAFAAGPLKDALLPYMLRKDKGGKLTVDNEAMLRVQSGEITFQEAIQQGASKFSGDRKAIEQLTTRSRELTAKVTRNLGAEGVQAMLLNQGQNMADKLNTDLTGGLMATGLNQDQARVMARMAEKPAFFKNLAKQQQAERRRLLFAAQRAPEAAEDGGMAGVIMNDILGSPLEAAQRRASGWLARKEDDTRMEAVGARRLRAGGFGFTDKDTVGLQATEAFAKRLNMGREDYVSSGRVLTTSMEYAGIGARNSMSRVIRGGHLGDSIMDGLESKQGLMSSNMRDAESVGSTTNMYIGMRRRDAAGAADDAKGLASIIGGKGASEKIRQAAVALAEGQEAKVSEISGRFGAKAGLLSEAEVRRSLKAQGMTDAQVSKIASSPGGLAQMMNVARMYMNQKTTKHVNAGSKELDSLQTDVLTDAHKESVKDVQAQVGSVLTNMGFGDMIGGTDSMEDLSPDEQELIAVLTDMTDGEGAALIGLALESSTLAGFKTPASKAGARMRAATSVGDRQAAKKKWAGLSSGVKNVLRARATRIAAGAPDSDDKKDFSDVTLAGVTKNMSALKKTKKNDTIGKVRARITALLGKKGVNTEGASGTTADQMQVVASLSSERKEALGADELVAAAEAGDGAAFLRAAQSMDGMDGDSAVLMKDSGGGGAAVKKQDALIAQTNKLAARFAQHAANQTTAIQQNTAELRRFNDAREKAGTPVQPAFQSK